MKQHRAERLLELSDIDAARTLVTTGTPDVDREAHAEVWTEWTITLEGGRGRSWRAKLPT